MGNVLDCYCATSLPPAPLDSIEDKIESGDLVWLQGQEVPCSLS